MAVPQCTITPMRDAPTTITTKVWTTTLKKLRVVASLRGERLVQLLDRLADDELVRLRADGFIVRLPSERDAG